MATLEAPCGKKAEAKASRRGLSLQLTIHSKVEIPVLPLNSSNNLREHGRRFSSGQLPEEAQPGCHVECSLVRPCTEDPAKSCLLLAQDWEMINVWF